MPNFENFEAEQSPEEKVVELEKQITDLQSEKESAVEAIKIETKKKKKHKKVEEDVRLELPDNPQTRQVEFEKDDKGKFYFIYEDEHGNETIATPGDLVSDIDYGIYYDLNHEIKSQEHRSKYNKFRRQYLAAVYQAEIDKLETELLLIKRLKIDRVDLDDYHIGQVYQELYDELKLDQPDIKEQAGFLFEKMINGLLTKLAIDLGDKWRFSVEKASVIDDVELKTDLIVKFLESEQANRGIGAQENAKIKGFQLTLIDKNDKKFQRKKEQVAKVKAQIAELKRLGRQTDFDDLALLETEVGNQAVISRYDKWKDKGKPAGGPEKFFSENQIMEFLAKIFEATDLDFEQNENFKTEVWQYFKK
ncbi:MAG: hypothetical protein GF365_00640 [Candidatus Buchananbacteria bacterium]|nr:hypothetical protein [Candidatus Buchananbacteria bacterium]